MTVSVGWNAKSVANLKMPLPQARPDEWPLPVFIVVDPACLVVDFEMACVLHRNVLRKAIDAIAGITVVMSSEKFQWKKLESGRRVVVFTCRVARVKRSRRILLPHEFADNVAPFNSQYDPI